MGVSDTPRTMRLNTLFRPLLDHHDRGISPYLPASSSEMKQETLLTYSRKIEVTVMKAQLDFEDGDLDADTNTVSYP